MNEILPVWTFTYIQESELNSLWDIITQVNVSIGKEYDVDRPRNLAKSVTVE